jgi:hypothetical protein
MILVSCCTITIDHNKLAPEYQGVDPKAEPYVNEFLSLAKIHNIVFIDKVTIGFKDIDQDSVIGLCNYGSYFREIDLDISYWNRSSKRSHMALLFHELSHCYCDREHDYGDGKEYGDSEKVKKDTVKKEGYFEDGCPLSIMYPIIVNDDCFVSHYSEYTDEMFNRCKAY